MRMRLTVEKYHGSFGAFWTNVYWLDVADFAAGAVKRDAIVAAERATYWGGTNITKSRLDDGVPDTENFLTAIHNVAGTRSVTGAGENLPLWVTCRVDFSVAGFGRPSRKFMRSVLTEADISGVTILPAALAIMQTYANAIVSAGTVDVDAEMVLSGAPSSRVAMRQTRRGSKKKVIP